LTLDPKRDIIAKEFFHRLDRLALHAHLFILPHRKLPCAFVTPEKGDQS
jgi:hypothetical protein